MKTICFVTTLVLCSFCLVGQPFNLNPAIVPLELKFEDHIPKGTDKANGRISINGLIQHTDTAYYYVTGVSMYAATHILASAGASESAEMQITLYKDNWKDALKQGAFASSKAWDATFKTEGDIGIRIIANKKPADFLLTIFTSKDIDFEPPTPFVKENADGAGIMGWVKKHWVIALLATVILFLITFIFLKMKKVKKTVSLMLLFLCVAFCSHAQNDMFDQVTPTDVTPIPATPPLAPLADDAPPQPRQVTDSEREFVEDNLDRLNSGIQNATNAYEAWNTLTTLNPGECSPDFNTNASAMLPSSCHGNADCNNCFRRAVNELNFIRRQLGRLSCMYNNTKTYTAAAISFGDNVSGIHALQGLAWQSERPGILNAMQSMKNACKQKYTDMMRSLEKALKSIDACEQSYGMEDWYQRFGFIYFEFMKEKYKIDD